MTENIRATILALTAFSTVILFVFCRAKVFKIKPNSDKNPYILYCRGVYLAILI